MHAILLAAVVLATPTPIPAATPQALPYPAYGTPAPGAAVQRAQAGVPVSVTRPQSIAIAAARSPILAIARSDYRLTQLSVDLARTGLYPNLAGTASITRAFGARGGNSGAIGGGFTSEGLNATLK